MNKSFKGRTLLVRDEEIFNILSRTQAAFSGMQKVDLKDPRFEESYEVYSTNQDEARYLLTTAFMDRLLKLFNIFNKKIIKDIGKDIPIEISIQTSFFDNKILLAIPVEDNMFEFASFFKPIENKEK